MIENKVKFSTFEGESTSMEKHDNLLGVIQTLYRWRKPVGYVCLIAAIGSAIISLVFMDNYYQSTTTFYPASPDLAKPKQVFGAGQSDMDYYGSEEDLDRVMTIAKSGELAGFLIDSFNLYQHYDIEPNQPKSKHKIQKKLSGLFSVIKTKYEAIELSIEDKDRELARDMVNAARNKVNETGQKIIKGNQSRLVKLIKLNIRDKEKELKTLGDSLVQMRKKYGIYNIETQSELIASLVARAETNLSENSARYEALKKIPGIKKDTIKYLSARIAGLQQQLKDLTSPESKSNFNLKRFNEGMAQVEVLAQLHEQAREQLSYNVERLNQFNSSFNSDIPAIILIEEGETPVIKSRPKRSIIVLASTLIAFICSLLAILLIETYREVNWKELLNAS